MAQQFINGTQFMDHDDFTTASGDNHNLDIHSTCIIVNTAHNNDALTGMIGETGISGEEVWVVNGHATNNLILKHNDAGSNAGFRVLTPTGTNVTLKPYEHVKLVYVDQAARTCWWLDINSISVQQALTSKVFSATVAGGAGDAVFYATDDGLVTGNALFSSIQSVDARFDSGDQNFGNDKPVVSNGTKTITTKCYQQTFTGVVVLGINVLGSNTIGNAPNGTTLTVVVTGVPV